MGLISLCRGQGSFYGRGKQYPNDVINFQLTFLPFCLLKEEREGVVCPLEVVSNLKS